MLAFFEYIRKLLIKSFGHLLVNMGKKDTGVLYYLKHQREMWRTEDVMNLWFEFRIRNREEIYITEWKIQKAKAAIHHVSVKRNLCTFTVIPLKLFFLDSTIYNPHLRKVFHQQYLVTDVWYCVMPGILWGQWGIYELFMLLYSAHHMQPFLRCWTWKKWIWVPLFFFFFVLEMLFSFLSLLLVSNMTRHPANCLSLGSWGGPYVCSVTST